MKKNPGNPTSERLKIDLYCSGDSNKFGREYDDFECDGY